MEMQAAVNVAMKWYFLGSVNFMSIGIRGVGLNIGYGSFLRRLVARVNRRMPAKLVGVLLKNQAVLHEDAKI